MCVRVRERKSEGDRERNRERANPFLNLIDCQNIPKQTVWNRETISLELFDGLPKQQPATPNPPVKPVSLSGLPDYPLVDAPHVGIRRVRYLR